MKFDEILAFLIPGYDPIQLFFGGLFLILIATTLIGVWRGATAESWEKRWNGNGQVDDLDVEHGSVNEISAAVASPGEKLADIMPGMLLILGLLGTFLGLGIALNKASAILLEANAGGGMDNAMANLMGMMEGLGTKFKTSTWGIMAFLLLKAWSARNGYEERRLRWCVGKMKAAFDFSRQAQQQERQQTQYALIEALGRIDQTLVSQGQASNALLETQCTLNKHAGAIQVATHKAVQGLQQALVPEMQALNAQARDALRETLTHLQQHGVTLGATHSAVQDLQQALLPEVQTLNTTNTQARDALLETVTHLQQHGITASTIHSAVQDLQQALLPEVQTLNTRTEQALEALRDTASTLQQNNEGQKQQIKAAHAAQKSLEHVEANISNLGAISEASTQMAGAASNVGLSAKELQSAISGFKDGVADVLGSIKQDLGSTIGQMGDSFTDNMATMSATMANATDGISNAVTHLSSNVGETMAKVQKSNEQSMEMQKTAQTEFLVTGETLNISIGSMTSLVEDLCGQIASGLAAVSDNGRRMLAVDSKFKDVTEKAARSAVAIEELVAELQKLQHASPLQPVMDNVAGRVEMIGHSLQRLDEHLLALKSAADDERQLHAIGQLQGPLQRIVERLENPAPRLEPVSISAEEA